MIDDDASKIKIITILFLVSKHALKLEHQNLLADKKYDFNYFLIVFFSSLYCVDVSKG